MFSSDWFIVLMRPWNITSTSDVLSLSGGVKADRNPVSFNFLKKRKTKQKQTSGDWLSIHFDIIFVNILKVNQEKTFNTLPQHLHLPSLNTSTFQASTPPPSKSFPIRPFWITTLDLHPCHSMKNHDDNRI